jgi:hypothetical protein
MQQGSSKTNIRDLIINILTGLVVILIVAVIALQMTIYLNPKVVFNPLPPYDMPDALVINIPTKPEFQSEPTPTEISVMIVQPTETRMPTATQQGTFSDGTPVVEETPVAPTETPFSGYYAFVLQNEINAIESALLKPNLGCNWIGVAGQVFDLQG